jgi:hypothetical protein
MRMFYSERLQAGIVDSSRCSSAAVDVHYTNG